MGREGKADKNGTTSVVRVCETFLAFERELDNEILEKDREGCSHGNGDSLWASLVFNIGETSGSHVRAERQ